MAWVAIFLRWESFCIRNDNFAYVIVIKKEGNVFFELVCQWVYGQHLNIAILESILFVKIMVFMIWLISNEAAGSCRKWQISEAFAARLFPLSKLNYPESRTFQAYRAHSNGNLVIVQTLTNFGENYPPEKWRHFQLFSNVDIEFARMLFQLLSDQYIYAVLSNEMSCG